MAGLTAAHEDRLHIGAVVEARRGPLLSTAGMGGQEEQDQEGASHMITVRRPGGDVMAGVLQVEPLSIAQSGLMFLVPDLD